MKVKELKEFLDHCNPEDFVIAIGNEENIFDTEAGSEVEGVIEVLARKDHYEIDNFVYLRF